MTKTPRGQGSSVNFSLMYPQCLILVYGWYTVGSQEIIGE